MQLPDPLKIDKYLYIRKTPTLKVTTLYFFGIISWLLVFIGFLGVWGIDPFFTWFVIPIMFFLTIYHLTSFGLNLFYKQFDLKKHINLISRYDKTPIVDIYLPICDEELELLDNTWRNIFNLKYPHNKVFVYVLDDSKRNSAQNKALATNYGFNYIERPNKGEMKKAGNLLYAFKQTHGEFIVVLDSDFAAHPDFLIETLPYMDNPKIGIVQTPQYFDLSEEAYKQNKIAYSAAFAEEPFYRFIQVTRNRFGGTICCGSNAVYRRSALDKIGGFYQIDYSEDAHTGYALTAIGYKVEYVPVLLAMGICPDNHYAFFHQQHRWCMGSMHLIRSKLFWNAKVPKRTKFCYLTGFMFYIHHPLIIIFSLQLFWTLFLYNEYVNAGNLLYWGNVLFSVIYVWLFPIAKLKKEYFTILIARMYSYSHAIFTAFFKIPVVWVSTNAKHKLVSKAFQQTISFIRFYIIASSILILLGLRSGDIHLLDYHFWTVQFWIFWNFIMSLIILLQLRETKKQIETTPA